MWISISQIHIFPPVKLLFYLLARGERGGEERERERRGEGGRERGREGEERGREGEREKVSVVFPYRHSSSRVRNTNQPNVCKVWNLES